MPQLVVSALKASGSWYSPVRRRSFPIPPRKQVGKPVATYATVRYAYTIEYPDDLLLDRCAIEPVLRETRIKDFDRHIRTARDRLELDRICARRCAERLCARRSRYTRRGSQAACRRSLQKSTSLARIASFFL